jgi:hypothetical protein
MAVNTKMPLTNTADGYLCEGTDIKGGYFVIDNKANIPSTIAKTGSLCYCQADAKFYIYNGIDWVEKEFGVTTEATDAAAGLMSAEDKEKLDSVDVGANKTIVDSVLSDTSANPVQNNVITEELRKISERTDIWYAQPDTKIAILENITVNDEPQVSNIDDIPNFDIPDVVTQYELIKDGTSYFFKFAHWDMDGTSAISPDFLIKENGTLDSSFGIQIIILPTEHMAAIVGTDNEEHIVSLYQVGARKLPEEYLPIPDAELDDNSERPVQNKIIKAALDTKLNSSAISDWAKASTKPSYTAEEVNALPNNTTLADLQDDADHRTVTDDEKETWNAKSTFSGNYSDLIGIPETFKPADHEHDYIPTSQKGTANGVAELDANGKVPTSQLPSYVDDVLEYTAENFPATGETGKIYVNTNTNKTYRWSGSQFVEISASLALGETSATAFRGDHGKTAYDHSQADHAPANAEKNQNAFSNIAVDGQETVEADSVSDTLTLIAGKNVTITTDAVNDKVTISAMDTTYSEATQSESGLMSATDKIKLDNVAAGAEVNVQSDWNVTDTNSDAYIKNKIPFKNGTGANSVSFVDGITAGNYSIAGGTADNNIIADLVGSLASALVSVEPPKASANLSISLGVNNESNSVGSMTLGVSNTTGIQGYFWHTINFTNKTITLSTKRPTIGSNKVSAPSSIDWEVGDYLYIVNDGRYPLQSKITDISGNTLTVDSLPFEANNYDSTLFGATVYPTSYTYPDDRTIYAIKINNYYEKEGDVSNLSADSKYIFRNGIAEATTGFASMAIGGMNAVSGILATATGYNNLAAGRFAHTEGMKNIAGDTAHVEGCKNKALGFASHSEGLFTQSNGAMAHAEGKYTIAEGGASHAEGWNT